jgi:hypothetical protein
MAAVTEAMAQLLRSETWSMGRRRRSGGCAGSGVARAAQRGSRVDGRIHQDGEALAEDARTRPVLVGHYPERRG